MFLACFCRIIQDKKAARRATILDFQPAAKCRSRRNQGIENVCVCFCKKLDLLEASAALWKNLIKLILLK